MLALFQPMPDSLPLNVLAWGRGWQWPEWIKHLERGKELSLYPDGSKSFCAGLFTGRDAVVRAGGRGSSLLLWLLVPAQGCPGSWTAWGPCSGQLPWADTWVWSLAQLKECYLLFACRNLSASSIMGGHFMGWQVQLEEIHGRETCCNNCIPKPQTSSWEAKLSSGMGW